ncbi:MAG: CDP-glycerol glycerophosphotransferase family protein [Lachnospiraceae bacterium]
MFLYKVKKVIKKFVDYRVENDVKCYRLKHTRLQFTRNMHQVYLKKWGMLPVNPKKIVVDNYMGSGYGCNCKYVIAQLLQEHKDLDIVWVVQNIEQQRHEFPEGVRLVTYKSQEAFYEYATAKIWLANYHVVQYLNLGLEKKPEQIYIQMWHGSFGIKKIENDCSLLTVDPNWVYYAKKNAAYTDYWISNSAFESDVYRHAFWQVNQILEYGHPRNDILVQLPEEKRRQVRKKLGLEAEEYSVLYVPTFRDNEQIEGFTLDYEKAAKALEKRFGGRWKMWIRMHPRMKTFAKQVIPQADFICDVTEYPDIQELLLAADVVITDYSSCIFDFLLTKKPGFLYATQADSYDASRGLYYPLTETPFPIASTNEKLEEQILSFDETVYQKKVDAFLKGKGSCEDGHAAERVAGLIDSLVKD